MSRTEAGVKATIPLVCAMPRTSRAVAARAESRKCDARKHESRLQSLIQGVSPCRDVDRAKEFFTKLGWRVDNDIVNGADFRAVQLTRPGSAASVTFGKGVTDAKPAHSVAGSSFQISWRLTSVSWSAVSRRPRSSRARRSLRRRASAVIAAFATSARPEHVRPDIRRIFKRNILDSLG